ncbi:MAG: hypothetical protein HYZ50_00065 [Deltaproteobacteria bacterium]|nr:hypothetical protein [Deltaproteobacteria bacterium]
MRYKHVLWLAPLLLWGSSFSPAWADSGEYKVGGLSLTGANGPGANDYTFTVQATTLTSTTSTPSTTSGFDFSFSGELGFGDPADPTPASGFAMELIDQDERKGTPASGTVVWTDTLEGAVTHTYPGPGTYTANVTTCCTAKIEVSAGSVYVYDIGDDLTDTLQVNIVDTPPPGQCQEETLFKKMQCLFGILDVGVDSAVISRPGVVKTLKNQKGFAKNKEALAEQLCGEGDDDQATIEMTRASVKMKALINTIDKNPYIDAAIEATLIGQGQPVKDLMDQLVTDGVCTGDQCLMTSPLTAVHCFTEELIAQVTATVSDAALAAFLNGKLGDVNERQAQVIEACDADKTKRAIGKVKSALSALKGFNAKLRIAERKGTIPANVATDLKTAADAISALLTGLLADPCA